MTESAVDSAVAHELYPDIDTLLNTETLSALEGRAVMEVRRAPFSSVDSLSGSQFLRVTTDGVDGERTYVLKRVAPEWDWIMRATEDTEGRAARAWAYGVYDRLPGVIESGVVACAHDGAGTALLLRDLSGALVPPGDAPVGLPEHAAFLEAMAALHAAFWEDAALVAPQRGFSSLRQHYRFLAPAVAARVLSEDPLAETPRLIAQGWAQLANADLIAPDVAAVIDALLRDPEPLCAQLRRYPQTLIHGDWKFGNMGVTVAPERRVVLLDWDRVGEGPAALDLAWYLAVNAARLPESKEDSIARYRAALVGQLGSAFSEDWWAPQLDLCLLGGMLQLGWPKLLGAALGDDATRRRERAELDWWSQCVRAGARRL